VALVVTFEAADEAAMLIGVRAAPAIPSASFDSPGVTCVPAAGKSPQFKEDVKAGDFEAAWTAAPVQLDASYSTPTQHHNRSNSFRPQRNGATVR
jgi:xanthine dehydrogenase YagR molybdenum-binding subunit